MAISLCDMKGEYPGLQTEMVDFEEVLHSGCRRFELARRSIVPVTEGQ